MGPYTCAERLLAATRQVNGSLPEPTAIPQREAGPVPITRPSHESAALYKTKVTIRISPNDCVLRLVREHCAKADRRKRRARPDPGRQRDACQPGSVMVYGFTRGSAGDRV
jgi:hypothetical protein